jgi:hypothetical protein
MTATADSSVSTSPAAEPDPGRDSSERPEPIILIPKYI